MRKPYLCALIIPPKIHFFSDKRFLENEVCGFSTAITRKCFYSGKPIWGGNLIVLPHLTPQIQCLPAMHSDRVSVLGFSIPALQAALNTLPPEPLPFLCHATKLMYALRLISIPLMGGLKGRWGLTIFQHLRSPPHCMSLRCTLIPSNCARCVGETGLVWRSLAILSSRLCILCLWHSFVTKQRYAFTLESFFVTKRLAFGGITLLLNFPIAELVEMSTKMFL